MNNLKNENKDNVSDIDYHLTEIETDLNRSKLDNNRNWNLIRLFEKVIKRINLLKRLITSEPRAYFNTIFEEMKRRLKEAFGELDGFFIIIKFKKDAKNSRMGKINLSIDKKVIENYE